MSAKYSFTLKSEDRRRVLPEKLILGRHETEPVTHVLLRVLAFVLLHRERLQVGARLHDDNIPFDPDLVQLDYQLRPAFWVQCGVCGVSKLDKLAVKVPEAELWIVTASLADAQELLAAMAKADLRRNRYDLLALDGAMVAELVGQLRSRNDLRLYEARFDDPPNLQLDFNGLWFDAPFTRLRF